MKKSFILIVALFILALAMPAKATQPEDIGLHEGDIIGSSVYGDPDIYIINKNHIRSYKRLFPNPTIFSFYGHLSFNNVRSITPNQRDMFPTSSLFKLSGDDRVYCLEMTGEDSAVLHHVTATGAQAVADDPDFFIKVFTISQAEFSWYGVG